MQWEHFSSTGQGQLRNSLTPIYRLPGSSRDGTREGVGCKHAIRLPLNWPGAGQTVSTPFMHIQYHPSSHNALTVSATLMTCNTHPHGNVMGPEQYVTSTWRAQSWGWVVVEHANDLRMRHLISCGWLYYPYLCPIMAAQFVCSLHGLWTVIEPFAICLRKWAASSDLQGQK